MNRNSRFKIAFIVLPVLTIVSLLYFKFIIIGSDRALSYFPFYKSMTYLDYAQTTGPGFLELVAFIGISIAFVFISIGRFSHEDKYIYLFLGIFEAVITVTVMINIIVFTMIHRDINVYMGPTILVLILNSGVAIWYGFPRKSQLDDEKQDPKPKASETARPAGEIVKEKREAAGMSQEDLANEIGVSRYTVIRWESGKTHPDMDYMIDVARALDFQADVFWGGSEEQMNNEISNVVKRGRIYQQAAQFLASLIIVVLVVFGVAYFGKDFHSPYLDRVDPFMKTQIGYVLVERSGQQKAVVIDNEFGEGNIVAINGSYTNQDEFIKVIHKGAYVKQEVRNVPRKDVPENIRDNLYQVSHFDDPSVGLHNLQLSYNKRYI